MKKLLVLAVLLVSSLSWAASFSVGGGLNFAVSSAGSGVGGHASFTVNDLVALGPVSVDLRTGVNFTLSGTLFFQAEVAPLLSLQLNPLTVYAGPILSFGSAGPSFGILGGARYPIALGLSAYAEGTYYPAFGLNLRGGVSYSFSF
jgi:hypothetical protein